MTLRSKLRSLLLSACLLVSACGYKEAQQARDPYGSMVGMNVVDLMDCAGVPDHVQQTAPDRALAQWDYKGEGQSVSISVILVGSLKLGGPESCKFVATVLRDGTVADVAFPGRLQGPTSLPYAGCNVIIDECISHPSSTQLPIGYNAFDYLPGLKGK